MMQEITGLIWVFSRYQFIYSFCKYLLCISWLRLYVGTGIQWQIRHSPHARRPLLLRGRQVLERWKWECSGTTSNHAMPICRLSLPFSPSSPLLSPSRRSFHTHYLMSSQTLKQCPCTLEPSTIPGWLIILSQRAWPAGCPASRGGAAMGPSTPEILIQRIGDETWHPGTLKTLPWLRASASSGNPPACPIHSTSWAFAATDPSYHPQITPGHSETPSPPLEFGLEIGGFSQPLLAL